MEEMIKCNVKPEFEIPAREAGFHWYRGLKIVVIPKDPQHPVYRYHNFPIRAVDYEKYFDPKRHKESVLIEFRKAMSYDALELIHDPERNTKVIKAPVKVSDELERKRNELLFASRSKKPMDGKRLELIERLKSEVAELEK